MAVSNRSARNIVVEGVRYRWRATGNDGWISLVVWPDALPGARLVGTFGYDQTPVPLGNGATALTRQRVITNRIVRRVILHAVRNAGYDPHRAGTQLDLGALDARIDLADAVRGR